jgi:hypothetical protein
LAATAPVSVVLLPAKVIPKIEAKPAAAAFRPLAIVSLVVKEVANS